MNKYSLVRKIFLISIILLGAFHAFASRYEMNPDGMSYIDIGEAYFRGDVAAAANSYWSPLYSWIIGAVLFLFRPSPYWEFPVVHAVNFILYVLALASFTFFIKELIYYRNNKENLEADSLYLHPFFIEMLGYTLFLVSSLNFITLKVVTPDILVAFFVYLISGIVLYLIRKEGKLILYILLGIILGFSYLAKAVMLPFVLIVFATSLFYEKNIYKSFPKVVLSVVGFTMIAGPFVYFLYTTKGQFTLGDSSTLNYSWIVNNVAGQFVHWQGNDVNGTPFHPTRKIFDSPAVYEFKEPISGTYPPWYNPSYWNAGLNVYFNFKNQLHATTVALREYYRLFITNYGALIVGFLIFLFISPRKLFLRRIIENWPFLIPALAILGMYALILVRDRYVGPFTALLWIGVFSGVYIRNSVDYKKISNSVILAMIVMMIFSVSLSSANDIYNTVYSLISGGGKEQHVQWLVSRSLQDSGLQSGDAVASIGIGISGFGSYWAHLGGLRVVAEVPADESDVFWAGSKETQIHVLEALKSTGAKAVVFKGTKEKSLADNWARVGDTDYYTYVFSD